MQTPVVLQEDDRLDAKAMLPKSDEEDRPKPVSELPEKEA
jgi:hypothetical protein